LKRNTNEYNRGETLSHALIHEAGLKLIRENGAAGKPLFAYLPWTLPHGQWGMPEDDPGWQKYKDMKWDAQNRRGQHDAQMYGAMMEMVDLAGAKPRPDTDGISLLPSLVGKDIAGRAQEQT
jgi:arylsulfatase A